MFMRETMTAIYTDQSSCALKTPGWSDGPVLAAENIYTSRRNSSTVVVILVLLLYAKPRGREGRGSRPCAIGMGAMGASEDVQKRLR